MLPSFLDRLDLQAFTDAAREVPYQQLSNALFPGLDVWVRRDDLVDPLISGNKAYKLIFNLIKARDQGVRTIITCGGAWSNHVHAVAAAGARFGFQTVGIIRGERSRRLSATLRDAERFGMKLEFVSRSQYRQRGACGFLFDLGLEREGGYFVPEGGANLAGVKGVQLLGRVIEETSPVAFDQVWVACGTGATFAGLFSSIQSMSVVGVEVLKAGDSILSNASYWIKRLACDSASGQADVQRLSEKSLGGCSQSLLSSFHCGGYGKFSPPLRKFKRAFEAQERVPLEPVYTCKLFNALHRRACEARRDEVERVLLLHSGGLQGLRGYE
ncbi:1-aminocyclopropane-1-carboxylate deaminase/D-cysteine desulfhydrase [Microbulbifer sp. GL-2]|uniref:1-aminocyclopropane-1-carboxylate deaminase/D-cysteine desulfhydrase n=1 Tax=Microbulbifer sp. GL-2 TaxID=2591606 RepID=UPI0011648F5C|nr:pyridoxal-phosphate dependent enzyme [Microbulbifer sp. GL-2]BBM03901.1 1-aminocyclopropane-1-carboxylate deaminase [Microbulbifer sp. GL-2]